MNYCKEQSFIVAYDEENNMRGKWNIVTNEYIGVRGAPIKSMPVAFKLGDNIMPEYLESVFRLKRDYPNAFYPYSEKIGKRLEQLISLRLIVANTYHIWGFLEKDTTRLNKETVQFLIDNCDGIYSEENIKNYKFYKAHLAFINKCAENKTWAMNVWQSVNTNIPTDFLEGMIIRAIHEKVYITEAHYSFANLLKEWYKMVTALGDTLEVKHNILTNFTILKYLYEQYRDAHYDEILERNNNLDWLYYENDNYIVRPLICRTDFHLEAEAQHNCVERMYMERVYSGSTHIVVVRKKDNPNKSYITCEVSNKREIWQYLYRNNTFVGHGADYAFKREYAAYLKSSLNK